MGLNWSQRSAVLLRRSRVRGNVQNMGLLDSPATQEALLCYERQYNLPLKSDWTRAAYLADDGDPLGAARGIILAVALGSSAWALILWALF